MKNFHVVGSGRVLIFKGQPTAVEELRSEPFVNDDRIALEKMVLAPLGLQRTDVLLAWCTPEGADEMAAFVEAARLDVVVSMARDVSFVEKGAQQGPTMRRNLPSLETLQQEPQRAFEMLRKLAAIRKRLDATSHRVTSTINLVTKGATPTDNGTILTPIHKASRTKQIVFGVVLDPYVIDAQSDWVPPAEIEDTAHAFMMRSRVIGLHHQGVAPDAALLESSVEQYPSENDRELAHANQPHRAFARQYGGDIVHSGAWIIGVKLSDALWQRHLSGELDAFSIEGSGFREAMTLQQMPQVTFVEIGEISRVTGRTTDEIAASRHQ